MRERALTHEEAREREHARRRDDPVRRAELLGPARPCAECEGTGRVAVPRLDPRPPYRPRGLVVQACMACLGTGDRRGLQQTCPTCGDKFTPEGIER